MLKYNSEQLLLLVCYCNSCAVLLMGASKSSLTAEGLPTKNSKYTYMKWGSNLVLHNVVALLQVFLEPLPSQNLLSTCILAFPVCSGEDDNWIHYTLSVGTHVYTSTHIIVTSECIFKYTHARYKKYYTYNIKYVYRNVLPGCKDWLNYNLTAVHGLQENDLNFLLCG